MRPQPFLNPAQATHVGPTHASVAWLRRGLVNDPGVLTLYAGRLRLETDAGVVFDAPLPAIERLTFPWYEFSGGLHLTVGGRRYKVSLTRPNGAELPAARLIGHGTELIAAGVAVNSIVEGRRSGKAWRALLGV